MPTDRRVLGWANGPDYDLQLAHTQVDSGRVGKSGVTGEADTDTVYCLSLRIVNLRMPFG